MILLRVSLVLWLTLVGPVGAEWRAEMVPTPGRVTSIEVLGAETRVAIGSNWYRIAATAGTLVPSPAHSFPAVPPGGLSDGRVATSDRAIARAWLADPTDRYRHGVLGDVVEAGSVVIERSDGRIGTVTSGASAVFEDLLPRIAILDGVDRVVVVKSYLERGSALAIIDAETMKIIAETPPIGHAHAWLNPAGIADFDGSGTTDVAVQDLNDWFRTHVQEDPHKPGRLLPDWYSVVNDIGLFLGDQMIARCPRLRWEFFTWGKKNVSYQRHVIMGFGTEDPKFKTNIDIDIAVATYAHRIVASHGSVPGYGTHSVRGVEIDVDAAAARQGYREVEDDAFWQWIRGAESRA